MEVENVKNILGKCGEDSQELATVGWIREITNKVVDDVKFKIAIEKGIKYLADKLFENEGIILDDSHVLTRAETAVLLYGAIQAYENSDALFNEITFFTYNYYYNNVNKKDSNIKSILISILIAICTNVGVQVGTIGINEAVRFFKEQVSESTITRFNELKYVLNSLEEINIYSDRNVNSQHCVYRLSKYKVDILTEDDLWVEVLLRNDDNIIIGYVRKSDILTNNK